MARKKMLAGNWKMYKTIPEAKQFIEQFGSQDAREDVEMVICAPFVLLPALVEYSDRAPVHFGAQNMYYEKEGAYTGEISPVMLQQLGIHYVILGHSERRSYFHENDEMIARKAQAAFAHNLIPILCVGETLSEYEAGSTQEVVERQLNAVLQTLSPDQAKQLVVAYEPVWAIGTGKTASAEGANGVAIYIRKQIALAFGEQVADQVRILYGGSVKPENIAQFVSQSDIDGALVGGASLKADSFKQMAMAMGR